MSTSPDSQPAASEVETASAAAPGVAGQGVAELRAEGNVLTHFPSCARFVGVALLGLALDLWSKHWAFHTLGQGHRPRVVIPYMLEFQTMLNDGALFGIGGGQTLLFIVASVCALVLVLWMYVQTSPRRWALQVALGAILAGALGNMYDRVFVRLMPDCPRVGQGVYAIRTGQDERGVQVQVYPPRENARAYTLSAGEVPREVGVVRDFIKIPTTVPDWSWVPQKIRGRELWPWVFNVADVLLVGGVLVLAIHLWRDRKPRRAAERNPVDSRASPA